MKALVRLLALFLLVPSLLFAADSSVVTSSANPSSQRDLILQRIATQHTLTSTTSEQALFPAAIDTITVASGLYALDCLIRLQSMSATSGNAALDPVGAGTATATAWHYRVNGADTDVGSTATAANATTNSSAQSGAAVVTATTSTGLMVHVVGTFDVTVAGTLIPSITLLTAAAATVEVGSYCRWERLGNTGITSLGAVQ